MKIKKFFENSKTLSSLFRSNIGRICRINAISQPKISLSQNISSNNLIPNSSFIDFQHKNFCDQNSKKYHFYHDEKIELLHTIIELSKQQEESLTKLENFFKDKKSNNLKQDSMESEKIETYSCHYNCLTINPLFSERFNKKSNKFLNFFITNSRNQLKSKLKNLIMENECLNDLKIQVSGSFGTGKTFALADFVVMERMLNLKSKNNIIIYYNFDKKSNDMCLDLIRKEIFSAIYPLIKDEIDKALNSQLEIGSLNLNKDSLSYLALELLGVITMNVENLNLIEQIFKAIRQISPKKQIILILDQINEVGKGFYKNEEEECSIALFDFFRKFKQSNLATVFCASNNNEFNRKNIIYGGPLKIINYDLNLNENEAASIIQSYGFKNETEEEKEYIKAILRITNKVPLFLNMLSEMKGMDNLQKIKVLKEKIKKDLSFKAENFFNNYYQNFENDEKDLFRKIMYYVNSNEIFQIDEIKEIIDYQLLELEFMDESVTLENKELKQIKNKNQVLIDFYNYLENNSHNISDDVPSKIVRVRKIRENVKIKTKYPEILQIYQEVFRKNNQVLISPQTLTIAIRDYRDNHYQQEKNSGLSQFRQIWGPLFEEILNLYISENKKSKLVPYPEELKFFENWEKEKYYDAIITTNKNQKTNLDTKKDYEILGMKDLSKLYSTYPPSKKELVIDFLDKLHFINFTSNHPSIDGGFIYLTTENKIVSSEGENEVISVGVSNIITYEVTVNDKTEKLNKEKIQYLTNNLKKIYQNFSTKENNLLMSLINKENFIKHYFIILENAEIYKLDADFNQSDFTKANKLHNHLNKYAGEHRNKFGIINARFVELEKERKEQLSIQLIPFTPEKI